MIIEDKRHKNTVIFNDLANDAIFEYNNQIYLKISNDALFINEIKINVINLGTYNLFYFPESVEIIPLKTRLIIEK